MRSWLIVPIDSTLPSTLSDKLFWIGGQEDNVSASFVPVSGVDLETLVTEVSREIDQRVVGIQTDGETISALVAEGGKATKQDMSLSEVLERATPSRRPVPEEAAAAMALARELGVRLAVEEGLGLPPGGWGLAEFGMGRGTMTLKGRRINLSQERFVLGRGRDGTEGFIGIWDRLAPGEPIQRFSRDEMEEATRFYLGLLDA